MINLKNIFPRKAEPVWVVPPGAVFDGDMSTPRSLRIDGTVTGNIHVEQRLIIGPGGEVNGNIDGNYILVQGKVTGNITGSVKVFVTETAIINGLIEAPEKDIREGATLQEAAMEKLPSAKEAQKQPTVTKETSAPQKQKVELTDKVEHIRTPMRAVNTNTWF